MHRLLPAQTLLFILLFLFSVDLLTAQYTGSAPYFPERGGLIINEISNGTGGAEEYIELLVTGAPSAPNTPVDIQGWILDDNNYPGGGQGNAQGHLVFGDCYQAVPPGSILVVYNGFDRNPKLPPDDPYDNNPADGVYIIPHTHNCLDACGSNPSSSTANYCPCANPAAQAEGWQVGLRNEGDMVQVRDRCETLVHAVFWGGIQTVPGVNGAPVTLSSPNPQGGRVFQFRPTTGNDWTDAANFPSLPSSANENPGAPNSAQNAAFITSLQQGAAAISGQIPDCKDTDAGDIVPPAEAAFMDIPLQLCYGEDYGPFARDYSQPDEFQPDADGFDFEYAFILTRNNPPDYDIEQFNTTGDFDLSALDPGSYLVWGFSYIQTNGSFGVESFLNTVGSITQIRNYSACGFDADLDNLSPEGIPMEIQVLPGSGFIESVTLEVCDTGTGQYTFNLVALEQDIVNGPVSGVTWFSDADGTMPIPNPASFTTGTTVVFAQPGTGACSTDPVPIYLNIVPPPKPALVIEQNIRCNGESSGRIALSISGGKTPYTIQWSNGASGGENLTDLPAGNYRVTVTDNLGCSGEAAISLTEPPVMDLICGATAPVVTLSGSEGIAQFELAGGISPFFIQIEGPLVSSFDFSGGHYEITGLKAGVYTISAADASGCMIQCSFEIGYPDCPFLLEFLPADISCFSAGDGAVNLNVYGGKGPYTFQWSNGAATKDLTGLAQGTYTVTVTDAALCTVAGGTTITEPTEITADLEASDPVCPGAEDGVISVRVVQGGTPPYQVSIPGFTSDFLTGFPYRMDSLKAGIYPVRILDRNGCETSYVLDLAEPAPLTLDLGPNQFIEQGDIVALLPVTNFQVVSFVWSPEGFFPTQDFQARFQPLESAVFTLEAFDPKGCSVTDEVLIGVARKPVPVFIPSAFSPNGDGVNDYFTVFSTEDLTEVRSLRVFDRWGGLVFQREHFAPNQPDLGWDGQSRGKLLPPGIYVYRVEVAEKDGKVARLKGEVLVVRE